MKIKACVETEKIKAKGPYSPALKASDFLFVSGQLPTDKNSAIILSSDICIQTKQCLENILSLLKEAGLDMSYVVKTTVYLSDMNDYSKMDQVYRTYFDEPFPARSVVEIKAMPLDALIQIDCIAIDYRCLEVLCYDETCCEDGCCSL